MSELTPAQRTEILERHLHDHGHVDPDDVDAAVVAAESAAGDGPSPALGARSSPGPGSTPSSEPDFSPTRSTPSPSTTHRPCRSPCSRTRRSVHNVIVCTLCSCYPSGLLGNPPAWYKSFEYRSRVVREPWGCSPSSAWRSTPTSSCASTTRPPSSATSCSRFDRLAPTAGTRSSSPRLVTRNSMIGTGRPLPP